MNKNTFLKSMNILESAFKEKMSKNAINIYWLRMKDYNDKEFKEAIIRCVDELKYFPRVANIRDILDGTNEDETELAWDYLIKIMEEKGYYQSVSFPKYPAIGAVIENIAGDWCKFIEMLTDDEEKWIRKLFIKIYPIMKRRSNYPEKLLGKFEIENSNKGYNEKIMLGIYGRRLDGRKADRELIEKKKAIK